MVDRRLRRGVPLGFLLLAACAAGARQPEATPVPWAIAIHGGAGTIPRDRPAAEQQEYLAALQAALRHGCDRLARGDAAVDVCAAVVTMLEDDPHFNAGKGAVFNEKGEHELDASIMEGHTRRCGAVAGVRTVKNPITLARAVMEKTRHVLLMGDGAEQFATLMGVPRVPNTYFDTEARRRVLDEVLRERAAAERVPKGAFLAVPKPAHTYGTVGCVVRDQRGHLAAATSTGGLTGKRWGRVGDSPVVGAGNYADGTAAVSGTGTGEQFLRHVVGHTIAARMQYGGQTLDQAVDAVVFHTLQPDDGGVIAVDRDGNLAAKFNSAGMYRGLANAAGRFDVRIFED